MTWTLQEALLVIAAVLFVFAVGARWADRYDRDHADAWQRHHGRRR